MTPLVELLHVSKRYGRQVALEDVTLAAQEGEILGIVGPNGAGKTTMLRVMAGLLRPRTGAVRVRLEDRRRLRYFGGERTLPPNVSGTEWLQLWGCTPSSTWRRSLGVLSRGTRQRIGLEATLQVEPPSAILLDEPWEGLDPDMSRWLSKALLLEQRKGAAVVVSSHRIHDLADVCTRCVFLVGGRLAAATVAFDEAVNSTARSVRLLAAFDRAMGRTQSAAQTPMLAASRNGEQLL